MDHGWPNVSFGDRKKIKLGARGRVQFSLVPLSSLVGRGLARPQFLHLNAGRSRVVRILNQIKSKIKSNPIISFILVLSLPTYHIMSFSIIIANYI